MNTISPVYNDYNTPLLWTIVAIAAIICAFSILLIHRGRRPVMLTYGICGLSGLTMIFTLLTISTEGEIDRQGTLAKVSSHYQVILPKIKPEEFWIKSNQSEIFVIPVTDAITQQVYPDARIVWDTERLSLVVREPATENYASLR